MSTDSRDDRIAEPPAEDPEATAPEPRPDQGEQAPARRRVVVGEVREEGFERRADRHHRGAGRAEADGSAAEEDDTAVRSRRAQRHDKERTGNPFVRGLKEIAVIGVIALVISFIIKTFIAQAFWIPTGSMENTLIRGDRVVVSKITAGPLSIERGDIAVFQDPGGWLAPTTPPDYGVMNPVVDVLEFVGLMPSSDGGHLIKRVIGVGGDHIVCCDDEGRITVNGAPLDETYLYPGDVPSLEAFDVVVPQDHYWMMGDHRSNSRDSRHNDDGSESGGAVPGEDMVGRAMVLLWPLDRFTWFDGARDVFADVPDQP